MRAVLILFFVPLLAFGSVASAADETKIGFVASPLGFGHRSFNDEIRSGMQACAGATGARVEDVVPSGAEGTYRALVLYATVNETEIIAQGGDAAHDVDAAARRFPNQHFTLIDGIVFEPNVASVTFAEAQGAYVAGALAGLFSRTHVVGFVGGEPSQRLTPLAVAFAAGARAAAPSSRVETAWVGSFADETAGRRSAVALAARGADVLYVVAGRAGFGALRLTRERSSLYAIGTDVDQDDVVPGKILTSIVKRVELPARVACEQAAAQKPAMGRRTLGFADGGLSLTPFRYTRAIIGSARLARLERIRRAVAAGAISVPGGAPRTAPARH